MESFCGLLRNDERYVLALRRLFEQYGYKRYKMSKFEEYDLYLENKSFIQSDRIITFSDPSTGKLLALKPDITLSIVKDAKASSVSEKVYYCENVYRACRGSDEIKEIMQTGLEYVGDVDIFAVCEVITIAVRSLEAVSRSYIMGISHLGIVTGILESARLSDLKKQRLMELIGSRSAHEIREFCAEEKVPPEISEKIETLATLFGSFDEILPKVEKTVYKTPAAAAFKELCDIYETLKAVGLGEKLRIDFSIMNSLSYYNGVIFQGFVDEIPFSILSGGRYDNLLRRFGRDSGAVGFAVYLDLLERFHKSAEMYDVDILLLYDSGACLPLLAKSVDELTASGKSVRAQKHDDGNIRYKELKRFDGGSVINA